MQTTFEVTAADVEQRGGIDCENTNCRNDKWGCSAEVTFTIGDMTIPAVYLCKLCIEQLREGTGA